MGKAGDLRNLMFETFKHTLPRRSGYRVRLLTSRAPDCDVKLAAMIAGLKITGC